MTTYIQQYIASMYDLFIDFQMDDDYKTHWFESPARRVVQHIQLGEDRYYSWRRERIAYQVAFKARMKYNMEDPRYYKCAPRTHREANRACTEAIRRLVKNPEDQEVLANAYMNVRLQNTETRLKLMSKFSDIWLLLDQHNKMFRGEWKSVPWENEDWFYTPLATAHAVHLSTVNPNLIAYNESNSKLRRDIQTQMKPGRYLQQFFGNVLRADQIKHWSNLVSLRAKGPQLKILNNDEWAGDERSLMNEWIDLYRKVRVDYSCMRGHQAVRVYGMKGNHLGLAYMESPEGDLIARSIVRFDNMEYIRAFPSTDGDYEIKTSDLEAAMESAGFSRGSLEGIKLHKIWYDEDYSYVCPYLDGDATNVSDHGSYLRVSGGGDYNAQNTDDYGIVEIDSSRYTCDHCGDRMGRDDGTWVDDGDAQVCEHCLENHYVYAYGRRGEQDWVRDQYCTEVDGEWYVDRYLSDNDIYSCDQCGDWHHIDDLARTYEDESLCEDCRVELDEPDADGNHYADPDRTVTLEDGRVVHESNADKFKEDEDEDEDEEVEGSRPDGTTAPEQLPEPAQLILIAA